VCAVHSYTHCTRVSSGWFSRQIFDRFRDFFRFLFYAHTLAFIAPLCVAFRRLPVFLVAATFAVSALLRPYPTQDDLAFAAALVACSAPLFAAHLRVRALSVAAIVFAVCIAAGRVSLFMWLGAGSGNANFFYFQSLIHVGCPAFALLECIAAARKHLATAAA
jgi:phosphatidylinositol glycan class U